MSNSPTAGGKALATAAPPGRKSARERRRATKREFDHEAVLAGAVVKTVALIDIDTKDDNLSFRKAIRRCRPDTFIPEAGVVDATSGHTMILLRDEASGRYRPLSGFRRLAGMIANPNVRAARCLVLEGVSDSTATVLAARANLDNPQPLTRAEEREAFRAECEALEKGGFGLPSLREFARQYRVSPSTPGNWLEALEKSTAQRSKSATESNGAVQLGHDEQSEAAGGTYTARETLESFKASVEMIEALSVEQLAEFIEGFRTCQQRLSEALARCVADAEAAA